MAKTAATEDGGKLELFLSIGLDRRTAENALVNPKVTANLINVIHEADVKNGCDKAVGNLLYMVATKFPANALNHRTFLLKCIVSSKVKNSAQLDAILSFLSNLGPESFNVNEFEEACGVGVEVSLDEIHSTVAAVLEENMSGILELRYHFNAMEVFHTVSKRRYSWLGLL